LHLTLAILRCPDSVVPETRSVANGEFTVGRGPGVDWILPDPERRLSRYHFTVAFRGGCWQIADISTNGTVLNRESTPIGAGNVRSLHDGDRLYVGAYEIEVRLVEEDGSRAVVGGSNPFSMDPFGPTGPRRTPFDKPSHPNPGVPATSPPLPADFDPLAPKPQETPFHGPSQADHSPATDDAFHPPAQVNLIPMHSEDVVPGDDLLPEDWDNDLLAEVAETARTPAVDEHLTAGTDRVI
jgi:type VI secretion system FHA domain protein